MNEETIKSDVIDIKWQQHHETILIDWADKANCYSWLHNESYHKYNNKRNWYTIPVIIMSTLTGTANFAFERVPKEYQDWYSIGVGSINILAGIITTIAQFLKLNELAEGHRIASLSWDKFYRNVKVELLKSYEERTDVNYFLKICKDEYDRLMESNPNIDNDILIKFKKTLTKGTSKAEIKRKEKIFDELNKPEILGEIRSTKEIMYSININEKIVKEEQERLDELIKIKKENDEKREQIKDFINKFEIKYQRHPTLDEIITNNEHLNEEEIRLYSKNT